MIGANFLYQKWLKKCSTGTLQPNQTKLTQPEMAGSSGTWCNQSKLIKDLYSQFQTENKVNGLV